MNYGDSDTPDQNLLRGAKSIADKIDYGSIILPVTAEDTKALEDIFNDSSFQKPDLKISIYKNRRGKYKGIYIWCKANLDCCRINPIFVTNYDYTLLDIDDIKIETEEQCAWHS